MKLTQRGQTVLGLAFVTGLLAMFGIAGAIETQANPASDEQCNDIYHAVWILEDNPARVGLIEIAYDLGCPFDDGHGNHIYEWQPLTD